MRANWLLAAAMLLGCFHSVAQEAKKVSDHEACALISGWAAAVMYARQSGVDAAQVMERAAGNDGAVTTWKREMILDAYAKPRWGTPERRLQAERDFKNDTYVRCMRS